MHRSHESLCHAGRHVTVQLHLLTREIGSFRPTILAGIRKIGSTNRAAQRELPARASMAGPARTSTVGSWTAPWKA